MIAELVAWGTTVSCFMIGSFVAGRTWMYLKLRERQMDTPESVFTVIGAFVLWWAFLIVIFAVWSAKKGLTSRDNHQLLKDAEQAALRRRIEQHERELMPQKSHPEAHRRSYSDDWDPM